MNVIVCGASATTLEQASYTPILIVRQLMYALLMKLIILINGVLVDGFQDGCQILTSIAMLNPHHGHAILLLVLPHITEKIFKIQLKFYVSERNVKSMQMQDKASPESSFMMQMIWVYLLINIQTAAQLLSTLDNNRLLLFIMVKIPAVLHFSLDLLEQ